MCPVASKNEQLSSRYMWPSHIGATCFDCMFDVSSTKSTKGRPEPRQHRSVSASLGKQTHRRNWPSNCLEGSSFLLYHQYADQFPNFENHLLHPFSGDHEHGHSIN